MTHTRKIRSDWTRWDEIPPHPGLVVVGTQPPRKDQTEFRKRALVLISDFERTRPVSYFDRREDRPMTTEQAWHVVHLNFQGAFHGTPVGPGSSHVGAPGNMSVFTERMLLRFFRPQGHISERLLMRDSFWERLHVELYPPRTPPKPVITDGIAHIHDGETFHLEQGGWQFDHGRYMDRWICPKCEEVVLLPKPQKEVEQMHPFNHRMGKHPFYKDGALVVACTERGCNHTEEPYA